jgi:VWFA-related protein
MQLRFALACGFCLLICGSMIAQTTSPSAAPASASSLADNAVPTFHSTSRLVLVDVVVTGKKGEFIRGLKPGDFTLLEDGKPQRISAFSAHLESGPAAPAPEVQLPPHQYTNFAAAPPDHPITIVLLDMLNTQFTDRTYARLEMLKFLASMPSGQPVALFMLGSKLRMLQGFTQSSDALVAAAKAILDKNEAAHLQTGDLDLEGAAQIDVITGRAPATASSVLASLQNEQAFQIDVRIRSTLISLQALSQMVVGYPGRKNLIWLAGDFPIAFGPNFDKDARQLNYLAYQRDVHELSSRLSSAQIAVYPIDVRGLQVGGGASSLLQPSGAAFSQAQSATLSRWNTEFTMSDIARETGGEAFFNQNDLHGLMMKSLSEGTNYYTLAYVPQDHDWNGKYRKIEVKTGIEGAKLRFRNGYYALSDPISNGTDATRLLGAAMLPYVPESTALLLKVQVLPPDADRKSASIDFAVDSGDLSFLDGPEQRKQTIIDFMAVALDKDQKEAGSAVSTVNASLRPETYQQVMKTGFPAHLDLDLKPGRYVLRLGAIERTSQKIGTVDVPVTVPALDPSQK